MEEIILGDYTMVPKYPLWFDLYRGYDIYLHDKKIGFVRFFDDMSLRRIFTNDTDLITILLLKYHPGLRFIHTKNDYERNTIR